MSPFDTAHTTACSTLIETMYRFWDIAGYLSKVADFDPPHLHLAPPYGVNPVKFRWHLWRQKTRVPGLSRGVVCVILRLAILVEHRLVTDTDRQTHRRDTGQRLVLQIHSIVWQLYRLCPTESTVQLHPLLCKSQHLCLSHSEYNSRSLQSSHCRSGPKWLSIQVTKVQSDQNRNSCAQWSLTAHPIWLIKYQQTSTLNRLSKFFISILLLKHSVH